MAKIIDSRLPIGPAMTAEDAEAVSEFLKTPRGSGTEARFPPAWVANRPALLTDQPDYAAWSLVAVRHPEDPFAPGNNYVLQLDRIDARASTVGWLVFLARDVFGSLGYRLYGHLSWTNAAGQERTLSTNGDNLTINTSISGAANPLAELQSAVSGDVAQLEFRAATAERQVAHLVNINGHNATYVAELKKRYAESHIRHIMWARMYGALFNKYVATVGVSPDDGVAAKKFRRVKDVDDPIAPAEGVEPDFIVVSKSAPQPDTQAAKRPPDRTRASEKSRRTVRRANTDPLTSSLFGAYLHGLLASVQ